MPVISGALLAGGGVALTTLGAAIKHWLSEKSADAAKTAANGARKGGEGTSLTEFTQITRNDFLTVVEDDLVGYEEISVVLDRLQTMASGYFLSAMSLLVDIPNVDVIGKLDQLSTDRMNNIKSKKMMNLSREGINCESLEFGLPAICSDRSINGFGLESIALEAAPAGMVKDSHEESETIDKNGNRSYSSKTKYKTPEEPKEPEPSKSRYSSDHKNLQTIDEQSNLATGKMLQVTFERDGNSTTVQVQIRLSVISTDSKSMENILSFGSLDNTFIERWYRFRAGELSFWSDLIFQNDLIKEAKKARIRDKSGFYKHMMKRRGGNLAAGAKSGKPSLNSASGIFVITQETADALEEKLGGSLENARIRDNVFNMTSSMLLAVVDRRWGMVNIYHRGLATHTELAIKDLKRIKGKSTDVEDILKAYSAGSAPAF